MSPVLSGMQSHEESHPVTCIEGMEPEALGSPALGSHAPSPITPACHEAFPLPHTSGSRFLPVVSHLPCPLTPSAPTCGQCSQDSPVSPQPPACFFHLLPMAPVGRFLESAHPVQGMDSSPSVTTPLPACPLFQPRDTHLHPRLCPANTPFLEATSPVFLSTPRA